jgi:hypothetical protein
MSKCIFHHSAEYGNENFSPDFAMGIENLYLAAIPTKVADLVRRNHIHCYFQCLDGALAVKRNG